MQRRCMLGFTLIELLVVISIIAILASMLLPAISVVKDMSMQSVCASQMRQIAMATSNYRIDNGELYPPFALGTGAQDWWSYGPGGRWQHFLQDFTDTYSVFNCPANKRKLDRNAVREVADGLAPRGYAPNGLVCLTAADTRVWYRYPKNGPNAWAPSAPFGPMSDAAASSYLAKLSTTNAAYMAPNPAARIELCPMISDGVWQNDGTNQSSNLMSGAYFPHRLASNFIFNDAHVENHKQADFRTFTPIVQLYR